MEMNLTIYMNYNLQQLTHLENSVKIPNTTDLTMQKGSKTLTPERFIIYF